MTDVQKLRLLLNILANQEIKLKGAREAFLFTQAYQYLVDVIKTMEKEIDVSNK